MRQIVLHFFAGAGASLIAFLAFTRASGATSFSLPTAPVVVGLACATMAHFATPWATPVIVLLYVVAGLDEPRIERAERRTPSKPDGCA